MKRLSPDDRAYCTKRVSFWQKLLGITNWKVFTVFGECEGNSRAEVECNHQGRVATIVFDKNFDVSWDKTDLDETCFHEIEEIKYTPIRSFLADEISDQLIHEWIRQDENTIFRLLAGHST
jgi:hypothetical protein